MNNSGTLCLLLLMKALFAYLRSGSKSYYISNIEEYEAVVELDDQSDVCGSRNDFVEFELRTPRAEQSNLSRKWTF